MELGPYSGRPEESSRISPYKGISDYLAKRNPDVEVRLASGGSTKSKSNLLYVAYFELVKADGTVTRHDATKFSACSEGITVGSGMGTEEQVRSIDDGSWTAYDNIDLVNVEKIILGVNIPTEGGIIEAHVDSPSGNLISTLEATKTSGKPVGGVYGASIPMEEKVLKLGVNEPKTLYLVYKAPADDEIDPATLKAAEESDVAVVFVGTDENTATEEADRLTLNLPGNQVNLIKAVAAVNKHTIVVMQTLGCVEVEEFKDLENIPGILWTGYNGQAQGAAIAKILFGDVTPGGKLNATWYKTVKDLPAITDYTLRGGEGKNGRTLWYFNKPVSYEFGYGISYTTFEYSDFRISKSAITPDDVVTISVDVKNTGNYDGDEVVQIYMTTPDSPASMQRPIKRLKGFERVTIPVGQTKTVSIDIDCSDLWFWDMEADMMTYDKGRYVFEVGSSSKDIRGTVTATMDYDVLTPELKTVVADCGVSVLKAGEEAQISVTACLDNDSFIDIKDADIRYKTNNDAVVTVSPDGKVKAAAQGVATIYADVTWGGKTVSSAFAVKVMPDLSLNTLKVDGKSYFKAGENQYSIIRKASAKAPVVTATAKDAALRVEIQQAEAVPGTAVVRVIDDVTADQETYLVNFGTKAVSDEFKSAPSSVWTVIREDKTGWTSQSGALAITTAAGDLSQENNNAANVFLQSANTDWTAETKITCSDTPGVPAQNAGIVAYQDDDNFVKLVYSAQMFRRGGQGGAAVQLACEENGFSKASVSANPEGVEGNTIWLRLQKKGDIYTAYYSVDGKKFVEAGKVETGLKDIQAGVMACDGVLAFRGFRRGAMPQADPKPMTASFDYFRISSSSSK